MEELCDLGMMSRTDILVTHLVQGVHNTDLKKTILKRIKDDLGGLVGSACMCCRSEQFSAAAEPDINGEATMEWRAHTG